MEDIEMKLQEHRCDALKVIERPNVNELDGYPMYGHAVLAIHHTKYGWVMHNYEYGDFITFCPFCGQEL
jgi:hypothetical protein